MTMEGLSANIYLTGFMGAGKTCAGNLLADSLRINFYDTDELLKTSLGMSIEEIFRSKGEIFFRDCETEVLRELAQKDPGTCVIATGGGVVLREENLEIMHQNGLIIFLEVSFEEAYNRIKGSAARPLLKGTDPKDAIAYLMRERMPFYQKADHTVQSTGISLQETVSNIIATIQKG